MKCPVSNDQMRAAMDRNGIPVNGIYPVKHICPTCKKKRVTFKQTIYTKKELEKELKNLNKDISNLQDKIAAVMESDLASDAESVRRLSNLQLLVKTALERKGILETQLNVAQ